MFKAGDRVICVDDNVNFPEWIIKGKIKNGSLYTIRSICKYRGGVRVHGVYQITSDYPEPNYEKVFKEHRFRKVWDNKQLKEFNIKNKEKEPVGIL